MAETPHRPDSANLEEALATLDSHLGYPPTPPIAARVAAHLRTHPAPQRAQGVARWLRLGAAAAALLLVLAGAGLLLSPEARSAVADRLGLPGVSITHTEPGPTPLATNLGAGLGLGERTTLAEARARSGFAVSAPTAPELGEPDEVFWGEPPRGGQVTLLYRARPGLPPAAESGAALLLTQFRGALEPNFLRKSLGAPTRVEAVTVNGGAGLWIEGAPHRLNLLGPDRQTFTATTRLAGNTLLWEQGGLTLRLEAAVAKDVALRLARTVR